MRTRTVIGLLILIAIVIGILYGWNEYHRKSPDLSDVDPVYKTEANQLIGEFESSSTVAEKKYLGKLVSVQGKVKDVVKDEGGDVTIVLGSSGMSGVRCSMDSSYRTESGNVKPGEDISVKGIFTGYQKDETGLLGSDVILNRCVLSREN